MKSEIRSSKAKTHPKSQSRHGKSKEDALALPAAIQAVTFDVGGTLIEPWPSVGHIYAAEAARHGCFGLSPEELNRRFAMAWRSQKDFRHTEAEWGAVVDATFGQLTNQRPSETFFPALFDRFAKAQAWRVYADVLPALERLAARGLKLGIISNWDERLRPLLRELNLNKYFQTMVVSCEIGFPKPAAAIFHQAVSELEVSSEAILHVGDSLEMDFQGAKAAGLQSVLLCRHEATPFPNQIRSLEELSSWRPS